MSNPKTIHEAASRLAADSKVSARVSELKGALAEKAFWTREMSVRALRDIAEGGDAKAGEIVSAVKELNAMHGYLAPTKAETKLTGGFRVEYSIVDPKA